MGDALRTRGAGGRLRGTDGLRRLTRWPRARPLSRPSPAFPPSHLGDGAWAASPGPLRTRRANSSDAPAVVPSASGALAKVVFLSSSGRRF